MRALHARQLLSSSTTFSSWRRCPGVCLSHSNKPHVASYVAASRTVTTSASTVTDPVVDLFAERLLAAPHRDATHVPYGDWLTLYVRARKAWKAALTTAAAAAATLSDTSAQTLLQEEQQAAKARMDALLWSSLFARHWTEVQPHAILAPASSRYRWWWRRELSTEDNSLSSLPPQGGRALEMCTCAFLTEPLLGGRYLEQWKEEVRAAAAVVPSSGTDHDFSMTEAPVVLLPFSALWALKRSAYCRPSTGHDAAASDAVTPFSLQERQARQALLHAIDQVLQLQADAAAAATNAGSRPSQRVCVLSPTEEWNLLCEAPRLRRLLYPSHAATSAPQWLSLENLCEDAVGRVAYCAHALDWKRRQQQTHAQPPVAAVRVLSPSSEHAHLRSLALTAVHEHSTDRWSLSSRRGRTAPEGGSGTSSSATTVHSQARRGCSDAVRRMSNREANIRQSFSVR